MLVKNQKRKLNYRYFNKYSDSKQEAKYLISLRLVNGKDVIDGGDYFKIDPDMYDLRSYGHLDQLTKLNMMIGLSNSYSKLEEGLMRKCMRETMHEDPNTSMGSGVSYPSIIYPSPKHYPEAMEESEVRHRLVHQFKIDGRLKNRRSDAFIVRPYENYVKDDSNDDDGLFGTKIDSFTMRRILRLVVCSRESVVSENVKKDLQQANHSKRYPMMFLY